MNTFLKTSSQSKKIFITKQPSILNNSKNRVTNKKLLVTSLIFLLIGLGVGFCKIYTSRLLHDEIYELARTNGNTLNPFTRDYPFDLKSEIIPAQKIINLQKTNYQKINVLSDIINYLKNFSNYTNHPPINSICAKFFILKQSSIANLRKFGFVAFLFFLVSTGVFINSLGLSPQLGLLTISILSNMSLINSLSYFGKGYSLSFALMLFSLTCFIKYQSKNKKKYLFFSFLFFHLSLLTHYFTGSIGLIMLFIIQYLYSRQKKIIELSIFAMTLVFYIPLFTGQVKDSNSYFNNHQGTLEFYNFISNFFQMLSLNYTYPLNLIIGSLILFLVYEGLKSKRDRVDWMLIICSVVPFFFFLIIDFMMNKHLSFIIRYELFAFVFFTILLAKILIQKPKIIGISILLISFLNLLNPSLQKHCGILNSADREIKMGMNYDIELLNKRTLFIMKDMSGSDLTFINHLFSNILDQHPLAEINPEKAKSNHKIQNLFFASKDIKKDKLKSLIKKNNIEQVFKI